MSSTKFAVLLLVLMLVPISEYFGTNSKIGSPAHYLEHGLMSFAGYVAMCSMLVVAIKLMFDNANREEGGTFASVLISLGTAIFLLQVLPPANTGWRLLPTLPWSFDGWFAFVVAIGVGVALFCAGIALIDGEKNSPPVFSGCLLFAISGNICLSFFGNNSVAIEPHDQRNTPAGIVSSATQFNDSMSTMEREQQRIKAVLDGFKTDANQLVQRLREQGVRSTEDFAKDETCRVLADELNELLTQYLMAKQRLEDLESVITKTRSLRRRAERLSTLRSIEKPTGHPGLPLEDLESDLRVNGSASPSESRVLEVDGLMNRMFKGVTTQTSEF